MSKKKPFWYPVLCDDAYFARLRKDYPDMAGESDSTLHYHYNDGKKYQCTWDHVGDAYEEFEPLADDYLKVRAGVDKFLEEMRETADGLTEDSTVDRTLSKMLYSLSDILEEYTSE